MLQDGLQVHARETPGALAVRCSGRSLTYGELDELAERWVKALASRGVGRGARVAVWMEKSFDAIAAMQATLRLGAAYVPVDVLAPVHRGAAIVRDCAPSCVVLSTRDSEPGRALAEHGVALLDPRDVQAFLPGRERHVRTSQGGSAGDLAYIMYTSGSTGSPKGVCISHENALAFVRWAVECVGVHAGDRLANQAPFHFDLSVFDIYGALFSGACVSIAPAGASYSPGSLVDFLRSEQITIWYSTPSVLMLMMKKGGLLEEPATHLRVILFAGEVFPLVHLRRLRGAFADARMFNWYGPTETNVCTSYEVGEIDPAREAPLPIGGPACCAALHVRNGSGSEVAVGEVGELIVTGPTVMQGYWGRKPTRANTYATGDMVRRVGDEELEYVGRIDQQVKVRGHRIELHDVEVALEQHPGVAQVAVVVAGSGVDARLVACVVPEPGVELGLLGLKRTCAERLPRYMIVDAWQPFDELPRNRNGKLDRKALSQKLNAEES